MGVAIGIERTVMGRVGDDCPGTPIVRSLKDCHLLVLFIPNAACAGVKGDSTEACPGLFQPGLQMKGLQRQIFSAPQVPFHLFMPLVLRDEKEREVRKRKEGKRKGREPL